MMWTRAELKGRAKEILRRFYLPAVVVCLIAGIFAGQYGSARSSSSSSVGSNTSIQSSYGTLLNGETLDENQIVQQGISMVSTFFGSVTGLIFLTMGFLISILGLLIKIFVGSPLEVGEQHFFLKAQVQEVKISDILYAFQCGNYGNIVITTFLMNVKTFLWSLLLVIPGIIKRYEYYMVPYILAENPYLDQARVFDLSRQMMDGEKMNAFVLELSFLPWQILGSITAGLSNVLWTQPYMAGTKAELYAVLRLRALEQGYAGRTELPGITV